MKKASLSAALLCLASLGVIPAALAQKTTVTASNINDGINPLTGSLCVLPSNITGAPAGYRLQGGGQIVANSRAPSCVAITAGALPSGFQVPDMFTVQPSPGTLQFIVKDSNFNVVRTDLVQPTGGTWNYDNFIPTTTLTVPAGSTFLTGNGAPSGACTQPSVYYQQDSSPAGKQYDCLASAWAAAPSGSGGGSGTITGVTAGSGLSGGGTTGAVTLNESTATNAQTGTTYTVATSDCGKQVTFSNTSAIAVTLPTAATLGTGCKVSFKALPASGGVTITPTTSTIDGGTSLSLYAPADAQIVSDGTNYESYGGYGWRGAVNPAYAANTYGPAYQTAAGSIGTVAPNTVALPYFLTQTGTGSAGAAPAWLSPSAALAAMGGAAGGTLSTSGLIADYDFTTGSYNDLTGISGAAVPCTSTHAPSISAATGLVFTYNSNVYTCVTLPVALNSALGFEFWYKTPNLGLNTSGAPAIYPTLMGGTTSSGSNAFLLYNQTYASTSYAPSAFSGGNFTVSSNDVLGGVNEVSYSCGSTPHIVENAQEATSYASTSTCGGLQTTGTYELGASGQGATFAFVGTIYRVRVFSTAPSVATLAADDPPIRQELQQKGFPVTPPKTVWAKPTIIFSGDSIPAGKGLTTPTSPTAGAYPWMIGTTGPYTFTPQVYAVSGINLKALLGGAPWQEFALCEGTGGPVAFSTEALTNDLTQFTAAAAFATQASYISLGQASGCNPIFIEDVISRTGNAGNVSGTPTMDSQAEAVDTLDRQAYSDGRVAGVYLVDDAANPLLGAAGANTNTTYFQSDNTHPTGGTSGGHGLIATAVHNALVRYYGGSTDGQPTQTTSCAYSQLLTDNVVTQSCASGASTFTALDCIAIAGTLGRTTVHNASSGVDTFTPINSEVVLGNAAIAAGSTGVFLPVVLNAATAGCSWSRIQ